MEIKPTQKTPRTSNVPLTTDSGKQTTGKISQPASKRYRRVVHSGTPPVQAKHKASRVRHLRMHSALVQRRSCDSTSRPQNPPWIAIVLQWFWGCTCSNTRSLAEQTTTFPAYSACAHAHIHIHTHRLRCSNWEADCITVASCYAKPELLCSRFPAVWKHFTQTLPQLVPEQFTTISLG
jgi:hypothetical protein